jgi:hypothetical protein
MYSPASTTCRGSPEVREAAVHRISSTTLPARGHRVECSARSGSTGYIDRATLKGRGKLLPPDSEVKQDMVQYFVQFDIH